MILYEIAIRRIMCERASWLVLRRPPGESKQHAPIAVMVMIMVGDTLFVDIMILMVLVMALDLVLNKG